MKKVLLLIHRLWSGGGTETYVLTLATELQRLGYQVGVMTTGGTWTALFRQRGIRVHTGPYQPQKLREIVARHRYQIVHANDASSFQIIRRSRLPRSIRVVFTVHGYYVPAATIRQCAPIAKSVVVVSPSLYQYVVRAGVPAKKVHVVANGVSTRVFRPNKDTYFRLKYRIPHRAFVIGYAGRFTFDKVQLGQRMARILRRYVATRPNTYVLIAGRNSKNVVSVSPRVAIVGHVGNMDRFYNNCNMMIGTGRVALESMACGIPTIAAGYASYLGPVTPSIARIAGKSNFGDHGASRHTWGDGRLIHDLNLVRRNPRASQANAAQVRKTIVNRYSARRMALRIDKFYR